jgi:3-oxoacyl-[acyl-carrier-protein] synthase III
MKFDNYIFTGFGFSTGKFKISNSDIFEAIEKGFLKGFSKEKIEKSLNYQEYKANKPESGPFDYFAGKVMGFYERHHVTPFPPTAKKLYYSDTSLELCVEAVRNSLVDACLQAKDIDAWFVSTVSQHEQAPGIAATVKSFFVPYANSTPAFTLASGCAGFNQNLERAIDFFKSNPNAKNIVVAHCETMSSFLTQRIKFVPFVTFGDASAAIVLTRIKDNERYGVMDIVNFHDIQMLDYVGVDRKRNLYMDDSLIKDRATINIPTAAKKCLELSNWKALDIDWLVPHQTGNVILLQAAKDIGIDVDKVFLDGQKYYGNVSGATVPLCFALMKNNESLKDGLKILSATAGVGGNYGAFTYLHKDFNPSQNVFDFHKNELKGKTALILGASGKIGRELAKELKARGANLILHANENANVLHEFRKDEVFTSNFNEHDSIQRFISQVKQKTDRIDYFINLSGSNDPDKCLSVNFYAPVKILNALINIVTDCVLFVGTSAEDIELVGSEDWVSSYRALHGYLSSASGEFLKYGIKSKYIQVGICESGLTAIFDEKYIFNFMLSSGQVSRLKSTDISYNLANSLYLPKVLRIKYSYENAMLTGRMGYQLEVDI